MSVLSGRDMFIFSFQDDNLSKYQQIFTKFGVCIDIVEIWFGNANGQIVSIFNRGIGPRYDNSCIFIVSCFFCFFLLLFFFLFFVCLFVFFVFFILFMISSSDLEVMRTAIKSWKV